jgi:hypothetical protein
LDDGNDATDDDILISVKNQFLPDINGPIDDSDILLFEPSSLGTNTLGTFSLVLDGSTVGLTTNSEEIDALTMTPGPDGRIVISTKGNYKVPKSPSGNLSGKKEDLIVLNPDNRWELYFDGSDVALTRSTENVWGAWINPFTVEVLLTTKDEYSVPGDPVHPLSGDQEEIILFTGTTGEDTSGTFSLFWNGDDNGFAGQRLDGISIEFINIPPELGPIGDKVVDELDTLTFTATATDPDIPPDTLTFSLDAVSVTAGMTINPSTGAFSWTPTEAQGPGIFSVTVTVTDDGTPPLSDSETIDITVNEVNEAPALDPIGDKTIDELSELAFTATATDADLPANNLTFSLDAAAIAAGMSINATTGAFSWTPDETQGGSIFNATITVTDDGAPNLSDFETISITVDDVNTAPVITSNGGGATANVNAAENQTSVTTVTATDGDLPAQTLTFTISGGADQAFFGIGAASGVLTFNAAPDLENPQDAGANNVYDVQVTVTDNGANPPNLTDVQDIAVTVTDVNEAPVITSTQITIATEGQPYTYDVEATDPDVGDTLTFSLDTAPTGMTIDASTGLIQWTPTNAQVGGNAVTARVTDSGGLFDTQIFTINVAPASTPPSAADDGPYDVTGNVGIDVPAGSGVFGNDTLGTPPATISTFDATSPNGGTVTMNNTTGAFTYTPAPGYEGPDSFNYTLMNTGGSSTATVSVTVSDMIWFIDNTAAAGGDGRLNTPFDSLSDHNANTADDNGDTIFIYSGSGPYSGGITLQANQLLVGQGATPSLASIVGITTVPAHSNALPSTGGTSPSLTTTSGNAIDLASGNTIRGLNIGTTSGFGLSGSEVGTLFVREVGIPGPFSTRLGGGVDLTSTTGAAINVVLDSLSASSSTVEGILLSGVSGDFDITDTNGTINNTGVSAIDITGAANPNEVDVGITLASVTANGGTTGIQISNAVGNFTVTDTTDIDNTTSEGINISGSSATFSFATVDIDIANPGADGIDLNGVTGSFTINSNGGGVAFDTAAPDDHHSIRIHNSDNVTIKGTAADCTTATKTTCFTITGAGTGGGQSGLGPDNSGFHAVAITQSGDIDLQFLNVIDHGGSNSGGADSGVFVVDPDAGSTLSIDDSFFNDVDEDAIEIEKRNMGVFNVNVRDNDFEGTLGSHMESAVHFDDWNMGAIVAVIDGNTIDQMDTQGLLIRPAGTSGTGATKNSFTITDNIMRDSDNNAIEIEANDSSVTDIFIKGNTLIGETDASDPFGDDEAIDIAVVGSGSTATLNVTIGGPNTADRNTIFRWDDDGIRVATVGTAIAGTINLTVENNLINDLDTGGGSNDIAMLVEVNDSATINARVINNDFGANTAGFEWDPRSSTASTTRVFLGGNESPLYDFYLQSSSTYELGVTAPNGQIGNTLTTPGTNATLDALLDGEGNTAVGGGAATYTFDAGINFLIVDKSTIPLP